MSEGDQQRAERRCGRFQTRSIFRQQPLGDDQACSEREQHQRSPSSMLSRVARYQAQASDAEGQADERPLGLLFRQKAQHDERQ